MSPVCLLITDDLILIAHYYVTIQTLCTDNVRREVVNSDFPTSIFSDNSTKKSLAMSNIINYVYTV